MNRRRTFYVFLSILALFLLGTVVVLSSVTYYLAIDPSAYLSELEVPILDNTTRWNASEHNQLERVPRIIHQTWKTEVLPARWNNISQECRDMMPDYEYMLWTDAGSREFIAQHYPWFLQTFDGYKYGIQRADVIRYFVLYHYGGVYIDLDIGCNRPMDPLLVYPVILPKTIPVGVSNDLMFAEKGHNFLEQTIHNLVTFDHSWVLNYPTVMFSTGPMFLSAQYGIYTSSHPTNSATDLRILPKSLYGKNAKEGEAPNSFFSHYYGSSWHADDAAFIGFLGTWGKGLMWAGLMVLIVGLLILPSKQRRSFRRISGYDVLLPRVSRSGRWHFHLGGPPSDTEYSTQPSSPDSESDINSPIDDSVPVLHLPFQVRSSSPTSSDASSPSDLFAGRVQNPITDAFYRIRNRFVSMAETDIREIPRTPIRPRRRRYIPGVLFFLPAIFTQTRDIEMNSPPASRTTWQPDPLNPASPPASRTSEYPPEKPCLSEDLESDTSDVDPLMAREHSSRVRQAQGSSSLIGDHFERPSRSPSRNSVNSSRSRNSSRPLITWDA